MWKSCVKAAFGELVMNGWDQINKFLETRVTPEAYHNWILNTEHEALEGNTLRVRVPDDVTRQWLEQEFAEQIHSAVQHLGLSVRHILYNVGIGPSSRSGNPAETVTFSNPISQLNSKFSFDNFVVGSSNQFAHAAARAVATSPSKSHNPLFIYCGAAIGT